MERSSSSWIYLPKGILAKIFYNQISNKLLSSLQKSSNLLVRNFESELKRELLFLYDSGMLAFFKKIQLDRIYRNFEKGSYLSFVIFKRYLTFSLSGMAFTRKTEEECTGYLKDKSVILNRTKPLGGREDKDGESRIIEEKKDKLRLTINHLQSVFLMLRV